jgi:ACS family sodium-dependent inorganic phosphate cotransporter
VSSGFTYWPRRYSVLGLSFCAIFICYIDRISISVAIIPMAEDYAWSPSTQGLVLSSFYIGYMLTQIAGGVLADRFGGRVVLGVGVLLWSIFTLLTPLAAGAGFGLLILCRIAMGMGEGVTFPSVYSLITRWMPPNEHAKAVAISQSGIPFGTIVALVATPYIASKWGWEWSFYGFGAIGFVWIVFWYWRTSATPAEHPTISAEEVSLLGEKTAARLTGSESVPWREFAKSKPVWAIVAGFFCGNWSLFVLLAWLPTFVSEGLGVDFEQVGVFAMMPHIVGFVSMNIFGTVGDRLIDAGYSITRIRKVMSAIAAGGVSSALLMVTHVDTAWAAIAIMCAGNLLGGAAVAGVNVSPMDIAPRHSGTILGIVNTIGTLPGIFGIYITGWILEVTGSWAMVFGVASAVNVFGLVVFLLWGTGKKQFD